jgi:hypothetical protein
MNDRSERRLLDVGEVLGVGGGMRPRVRRPIPVAERGTGAKTSPLVDPKDMERVEDAAREFLTDVEDAKGRLDEELGRLNAHARGQFDRFLPAVGDAVATLRSALAQFELRAKYLKASGGGRRVTVPED